ncbi:DctP family TRAP transporter solute-binding subunit [Tropicimonas sp. IMCC6043]|uniref:DctP family TRAP transporter solute-binding subunit n=1 Tax=Tropicimonas sp. IMCC6043 TaxID=2510645 RepID=UPI00101BF831|nr:DctP family TRAP transporter solute-binding subunit [Tropicimonas sp. IMCC6043]RYH07551.1 DctP family TRAP transporter solute-binding subunit [Tropicimonas sp. IMCC6043]
MFSDVRFKVAAAMTAVVIAAQPVSAEVIKFGMNAPQGDNPEWNALEAFKNHVEYKTEGAIEVKLFPSAQLGAERACAEQVQQGTVEVCLVDTGALAGFYNNIQVLSVPYLFKSSAHAWKVFDSPFFAKLAEDMRATTGIRVMAWGENGFRDFTNNVRPIRSPEDLDGLKMRVMESPVFIRFVESFGAAATPMPGSEIIMAAKQGVIDGQENPAQVNYDYNLMDVQKYMSTDEHILGVHAYIISDSFFEKLSDENKAVVLEAALLASRIENTQKLAGAKKYIDLIKEKGVEVHMTTMAEKEAFAEVSQEPVLEYLREQVGADLVEELLTTAKDAEPALYGN